jgi:hypothetical protein
MFLHEIQRGNKTTQLLAVLYNSPIIKNKAFKDKDYLENGALLAFKKTTFDLSFNYYYSPNQPLYQYV